MTENIYGMLKWRFPIFKLQNMIKIVTACAILHNMSVSWADEQPELDHPALGPNQLPRIANPNIIVPAIPVPQYFLDQAVIVVYFPRTGRRIPSRWRFRVPHQYKTDNGIQKSPRY